MNALLTLLTGLSLLAFSNQTMAQGGATPLNDPGYSTGNYKHTNKAAAARRWEGKTGVSVQAPAPQNGQLANYKNQVPNQQPAGGVTVPHVPNEELANRNYKANQVQPTQRTADELTRRRTQKRRTDTAIGD